jgi:hypothetical protein
VEIRLARKCNFALVWGKYFASVEAMPNSTLDYSLCLPLELRGNR